jgi:hypothetical protein
MMHWPVPLSRARAEPSVGAARHAPDPIGDHLHAVVTEYARAKADAIRAHEARVTGMIDALVLTFEQASARGES